MLPPDRLLQFPGAKKGLMPAQARGEGQEVIAAPRARGELAQLVRLHPGARGLLGGQEVAYAAAMRMCRFTTAGNSPNVR